VFNVPQQAPRIIITMPFFISRILPSSMFKHLYNVEPARKTRRVSSWDVTGGNEDFWRIQSGESRVLAAIDGPGIITHIWSCFIAPWRDLLLQFTWDDASSPSINVPFGDFFGLGHGLVNSYQSFLFSTSTNFKNTFNNWCAHNCYVPMPFKKSARIVLVNQSPVEFGMWFYVDYETVPLKDVSGAGYFQAEFHRELPFGGWGHEIPVNSPEVDEVTNTAEIAWKNNHVILETRGKGQYIGCNLSVTNLRSSVFKDYGQPGYSWWGEGDDMIWVDGYKWPPDLHGTGSEDYFNHGLGMQPVTFLRTGSSLYEFETGGYQTCYVHHLDNPVRFTKEIKVTIEIGHANHLANEVSSVAYWYATEPVTVANPPPVEKRRAVPKKEGVWFVDPATTHVTRQVPLNPAMMAARNNWARASLKPYELAIGNVTVQASGIPAIKVSKTIFGQGAAIDVMVSEILEGHLPVIALISIDGHDLVGRLVAGNDGRLSLDPVNAGIQPVSVDDMLLPLAGKRVKLVFGRLLPAEKAPGSAAECILEIGSKLNFRDG
jgi:hypothetical protein